MKRFNAHRMGHQAVMNQSRLIRNIRADRHPPPKGAALTMMEKQMHRPTIPALFAAVLAVTAAGAQSPSWSHAQPVTVELSNFKFTPSTLTLRQGTPYLIHFSNTASGGHDFVAKEFFAAATVAAEDQSKAKGGEISLGAGDTVDVRLVANRPGTYKSHCSHFMHSSFGMTGTIIVQ
jgi:plastocyanin